MKSKGESFDRLEEGLDAVAKKSCLKHGGGSKSSPEKGDTIDGNSAMLGVISKRKVSFSGDVGFSFIDDVISMGDSTGIESKGEEDPENSFDSDEFDTGLGKGLDLLNLQSSLDKEETNDGRHSVSEETSFTAISAIQRMKTYIHTSSNFQLTEERKFSLAKPLAKRFSSHYDSDEDDSCNEDEVGNLTKSLIEAEEEFDKFRTKTRDQENYSEGKSVIKNITNNRRGISPMKGLTETDLSSETDTVRTEYELMDDEEATSKNRINEKKKIPWFTSKVLCCTQPLCCCWKGGSRKELGTQK